MGFLAKAATTAVVIAAIWLMYGQQSTATPSHRPAVHATAHHPAAKKARR